MMITSSIILVGCSLWQNSWTLDTPNTSTWNTDEKVKITSQTDNTFCKINSYNEILNPILRNNLFGFIADTNSWSKVMINWKESWEYFDIENLIVSSWWSVWYISRDMNWISSFIINWKEEWKYPFIYWAEFLDSQNYLYLVKDESNKYAIIINWEKVLSLDDYDISSLMKVNWHIFFIWKMDDLWFVVKDGKKYSKTYPWFYTTTYNFKASTNGESYVAVTSPNKDWYETFIKDWNELGLFKNIWDVIISGNWEKYAFTLNQDGKTKINKDGAILEVPYDEVLFPTYSYDWTSFSFWGKKNWKTYIIKDGIELWWEYSAIGSFNYSPLWKHFFFEATTIDGNRIIVLDNREIGLYDSYSQWKIHEFSNDDIDYIFWSYNYENKEWILISKYKTFTVKAQQDNSRLSIAFNPKLINKSIVYWQGIEPIAIDWTTVDVGGWNIETLSINFWDNWDMVLWYRDSLTRHRWIKYNWKELCK